MLRLHILCIVYRCCSQRLGAFLLENSTRNRITFFIHVLIHNTSACPLLYTYWFQYTFFSSLFNSQQRNWQVQGKKVNERNGEQAALLLKQQPHPANHRLINKTLGVHTTQYKYYIHIDFTDKYLYIEINKVIDNISLLYIEMSQEKSLASICKYIEIIKRSKQKHT